MDIYQVVVICDYGIGCDKKFSSYIYNVPCSNISESDHKLLMNAKNRFLFFDDFKRIQRRLSLELSDIKGNIVDTIIMVVIV